MRPVNLIPPSERRGTRVPGRTGGLGYLVLAGLGLALAAIVGLVLTNNLISDRQAEVAALEQEEVAAQARLESVRAFSDFAAVQERRALTVISLAESRFDWERVMQELSRVTPADVWLVNLTGSVSPEVSLDNGAGIAIRSEVAGPALELIGCARSQDAVAGFITSLGDIDGVTRVTAAKSERPGGKSSPGGGSDSGTSVECRTRDFIVRFEVVAAFDAVPVPALSSPPPPAPAPPLDGGGSQSGSPAKAEQEPAGSGQTAGEPPEIITGGAR